MKALLLMALFVSSNAFAFMSAGEVVTCKSKSGRTVLKLVNFVSSPEGYDDPAASITVIKGNRSYEMSGPYTLYATGAGWSFKAETGEQLEIGASKLGAGYGEWIRNGKKVVLECDFQ